MPTKAALTTLKTQKTKNYGQIQKIGRLILDDNLLDEKEEIKHREEVEEKLTSSRKSMSGRIQEKLPSSKTESISVSSSESISESQKTPV